jgi:hypothetical protein
LAEIGADFQNPNQNLIFIKKKPKTRFQVPFLWGIGIVLIFYTIKTFLFTKLKNCPTLKLPPFNNKSNNKQFSRFKKFNW